ncbi:cation:H+ antiporter [Clostridiales Family XIII bacterium PM5-7]
MIYIAYFVVAALVIIFSIKAANYIDLLDKNTKLSGAFLGGIMLSAVTSLPELFTSISATVLLREPGLCIGNILGSDLFNLMAISVAILFYFKQFSKGRVSKSYRTVTLMVLSIYGIIALSVFGILQAEIFHIKITSIIIVILYCVGAKYLAIVEDVETDEDVLNYHAKVTSKLMVKQIGIRFSIVSLGIVVFSILLTYLTDQIADTLKLNQGWAGAILLGIATSLPEVTSTITLFRMKNYNIAVGNIIGSNLFNFIILAIADFAAISYGVYILPDVSALALLICGTISTIMFWIMLKYKNMTTQIVCCGTIICSYIVFLAV